MPHRPQALHNLLVGRSISLPRGRVIAGIHRLQVLHLARQEGESIESAQGLSLRKKPDPKLQHKALGEKGSFTRVEAVSLA